MIIIPWDFVFLLCCVLTVRNILCLLSINAMGNSAVLHELAQSGINGIKLWLVLFISSKIWLFFVKQLLVETGEHNMTVHEFPVDERLSFTLFQECCHVLGGYYPNFTTRRQNYFLLQIWFELRGSPRVIHCDMILSWQLSNQFRLLVSVAEAHFQFTIVEHNGDDF